MTTPEALLAELRARGVQLRAVGDRLRYKPASALTPAEVEVLRRHKPAVIALLEVAVPVPSVPAVPPLRDLIEAYRTVLGRLWLLNVPSESRSPHAHAADLADARQLLAEQARFCDELGPEFAAAVSREHAKWWAAAMGRCPWCGLENTYHDPDDGTERPL